MTDEKSVTTSVDGLVGNGGLNERMFCEIHKKKAHHWWIQ
jgi:hypothetical protein